MTTISNMALLVIRGDRRVKGLLAIHFRKHYNTIENWIKNRDAMLTTPDAVKVISEETGLTQEQILEESEIMV